MGRRRRCLQRHELFRACPGRARGRARALVSSAVRSSHKSRRGAARGRCSSLPRPIMFALIRNSSRPMSMRRSSRSEPTVSGAATRAQNFGASLASTRLISSSQRSARSPGPGAESQPTSARRPQNMVSAWMPRRRGRDDQTPRSQPSTPIDKLSSNASNGMMVVGLSRRRLANLIESDGCLISPVRFKTCDNRHGRACVSDGDNHGYQTRRWP